MKKNIKCTFLAIVLMTLFLSSCYVKKNKQVTRTAIHEKEAIDKGVAFLLSRQMDDGSWGNHAGGVIYEYELYMGTTAAYKTWGLATTGLACMALMDAGSMGYDVEEALTKGMKHLVATQPNRRSHGSEFYNVWSLNYVSQAMSRYILYPHRNIEVAKLRRTAANWYAVLDHYQTAAGGWGYFDFKHSMAKPSGEFITSFLTGAILLNLKEAQDAGVELPETMIRTAVIALDRMRLPTKTFAYSQSWVISPLGRASNIKGSLGRVQAGNIGLYVHGKSVTEEDMILGMDRLVQHHHFMEIARGRQRPHETWYANAPYYYYFGHFYAAEVTKRLPADVQTRYWEYLAQWMLNAQQKDGSWWDWKFTGYQKEYGTAYALMVLIPAHQSLQTAEHK